jgi:mannose-1-phosphate guanylyltransferase / phosphomannomutase
VRSERAQGGITVRLVPGDPQSVVLRFFDADGTDINAATQRKIERYYHRQDYRRAFAADIGDIGFPPRALEYYTAALMRSVDADAIRAASYRVVLDYAYGTTAFVMPNVLSKLGADVLSVNPFASTAGAAAFEVDVQARRVAELVRTAKAHLGAVIDPDGEHITLIDDEGHVLSNDEALMALLTLVTSTREHASVALPVAVSSQAERIAREAGAEITWTKLSTPHLMAVAAGRGVMWAASQEGGFIWPEFLPAYDAAASLVNVLQLLAASGLRLSKIVAGLPRTWIAHESVVTPWEHKGLVMRSLVERSKDRELVLVDGVKVIHDAGWALVLPDPDEPVTHVWAEGSSDADAVRLAQEYARRIRQILR